MQAEFFRIGAKENISIEEGTGIRELEKNT